MNLSKLNYHTIFRINILVRFVIKIATSSVQTFSNTQRVLYLKSALDPWFFLFADVTQCTFTQSRVFPPRGGETRVKHLERRLIAWRA